jgi:hypothetical protein
MKVLRSILLAAAALVAVACGDKVNVVQPTPATPAVQSVTVAPSTATIIVGQTLNLTAAVSADAGATYTVAWTTSDASKVSVNATTGAISGVAVTPGVAICATAGGKSGCASIIVSAGAGTTPATVSIASITAGTLLIPVPVPPGVTAGQINVQLNIAANSVSLDSVIVTVDGVTAAKQSFSAAQAAALLTASEMTLEQSVSVQVVLSINTADFNTTTGVTKWKNGLRNIGAKTFGKFAGTSIASSSTVAQAVQVLFGNVSGFIGTMTLTPTAPAVATATDAAGYSWKAGSMAITALPVIYGVETVLNATVSFNTIGCSAATGKLLPLTAPVAPSALWTGTFTQTNPSPQTATDVSDYELNAGACPVALSGGGEIPNITAVGSDNNNIVIVGAGVLGGGGFLNAATSTLRPDPNFVVRLDNVTPSTPTFIQQSSNGTNTGCALNGTTATQFGGRTNCWFNDAVVLNGLQTGFGVAGTSGNGMILGGGADLGSGRVIGTATGVVFTARAGAAADASATVDATAAITSTAGLAETANNATYRLRVRSVDAVGNTRNTSAGTIGVDRTAPTLTFVGGPADGARNTVPGGAYTLGATDNATAPAAPSAFFNLALTPLRVSQLRREATIGSRFWCPTTASFVQAPTNGSCTAWITGTSYAANLNFSDVNGSALDAYFTATATVNDQAGNVSPAVSSVELVDATAPAIGGLSYSPFLVAGGPATFSSTDIDNLDIQSERMNLIFGLIQPGAAGTFAATLFDANSGAAFAPGTAAGGSTFWFPDKVVNAYNVSPLITTNAFSFTIPNLPTQIEVTGTANGTNGAAINANGVVNTANGIVINQANTATASATPIIPAAIPANSAITNTGGSNNGPLAFVICGTAQVGGLCPAPYATLLTGNTVISRDGAAPNTVTITAQAQGLTGSTIVGPATVPPQFSNPFSAVQFWAYNPTIGPLEGWRLIGTVNGTTVTDGGLAAPNGRNWNFTFTWDPNAVTAPTTGATYKIVAIGISSVAGGAALSCAPSILACTGSVGMALATPIGAVSVTVAP